MNYLSFLCLFLIACTTIPPASKNTEPEIIKQLEQLNEIIVESALKNDLEKRLSIYNQDPICMPDHQVSMQGISHLKLYHKSIFEQQKLTAYEKKITKIYPIKNRIIEIGSFEKTGTRTSDQSTFLHQGKYLNVWTFDKNDQLKLAIETWNYDAPIEDLTSILVDVPAAENHGTFDIQKDLSSRQSMQLAEVKTIIKKGVKERDGNLRATIYHDDAIFMPHDEPMMIGKEQIIEHLIAYNSGNVTIDSIHGGTNWVENLGDFILESSNYYVEWHVENFSGIGKGKGIRLWKKTKEGKQKILLNIALRDKNPS